LAAHYKKRVQQEQLQHLIFPFFLSENHPEKKHIHSVWMLSPFDFPDSLRYNSFYQESSI